MKNYIFILILAIFALFPMAHLAKASSFPDASFAEIAQTSDLIFIGTVDKQVNQVADNKRMAFTDVSFKDVKVIYATERAKQTKSSIISLSIAGGSIGEYYIEVGDTPKFENGKRYLLCVYDDGKVHVNPVVGGQQGMFKVIKDLASTEEYIMRDGGGIAIGTNHSGFVTIGENYTQIRNGIILFDKEPSSSRVGHVPPAIPSNSVGVPLPASKKNNYHLPYHALRLQEVVNYIKEEALKQTIKEKVFPSGERNGFSYKREGNKITKEENKPSKMPDISIPGASSSITPHTDLGACGFQFLPIVMEQVAETDEYYDTNNRCMDIWNRYMDIYRITKDDGTYGFLNFESEFCGFVSDENLATAYGEVWDKNIAFCFTLRIGGPCGLIVESDILLNPHYNFTIVPDLVLFQPNLILMQPTIMHELGHSWGYQTGILEETYKYDFPSVMHRVYAGIIEDGEGIHAVDAFLLRRTYKDQTIISPITDVSVESYYASSVTVPNNAGSPDASDTSLFNASLDRSSNLYEPGQEIIFQDITVQNNSFSSVSDMQLHIFLSPTRALSPNAYEVNNYWYWPTFPGEDLYVGSYKTMLPKDIPRGKYYVVAKLTVNGDKSDDFIFNNITSFFKTINVTGPPPEITSVKVVDKALTVIGKNFDKDSLIILNGLTTLIPSNTSTNTTLSTNLIDKIQKGATITIRVENIDGTKSNDFKYMQSK